jgi:hypothetical protein
MDNQTIPPVVDLNSDTGKYTIHYADRSFETDEPILFFANPHIPYSCEITSPTHCGYACLFTEESLQLNERSQSLQQSPLFKIFDHSRGIENAAFGKLFQTKKCG